MNEPKIYGFWLELTVIYLNTRTPKARVIKETFVLSDFIKIKTFAFQKTPLTK